MAIKTSKMREAKYASYQVAKKQETNRRKKLLKLQKEQPNNIQIEAALKDIRYRRHTPKVPYWSHSMRATARLFKVFTGKFDRGVFSSDPKINAAAIRIRNENIFEHYKMPEMKQASQFSIKERAHTKDGVRAWI